MFCPAAISIGQKKNWLKQHISSFWKYDAHLALLCLCAPAVLAASLLLQGKSRAGGRLRSDFNHSCRCKYHFFCCPVFSSPGNWAAARN